MLNNNSYGAIAQLQKEKFNSNFTASNLINQDFIKLAKSFAFKTLKAKFGKLQAVKPRLKKALIDKNPWLIEISMPSNIYIEKFPLEKI